MKTCCSTLTHYRDTKPTSLWSFSLMLHAYRRSNQYQFHCLWFDPMIYSTQGMHVNHYITNAGQLGNGYLNIIYIHVFNYDKTYTHYIFFFKLNVFLKKK